MSICKSENKRRQQNQKFPSFQIFRFAAEGVGGAANKNDRKFLGFAPREQGARGRGARVIRKNPADFARNTFELRPIHTAMKIKLVNFAVFVMFFGIALIEAFQRQSWVEAGLFLALGVMFLWADFKEN